MSEAISFQDWAVVACGTMGPELDHLKQTGFLNAAELIYTPPGEHQNCEKLEQKLAEAIGRARTTAEKIIVVYGGTHCYLNRARPERTIDTVIERLHPRAYRTDAANCVDMLADAEQRKAMSGSREIYWITPGWIKHREFVFGDWDKDVADEAFPTYDGGALVLDAVGCYDQIAHDEPETLMELSDWMKISIAPRTVTLDRLKGLLADCVIRDLELALTDTAGQDARTTAELAKKLAAAKTVREALRNDSIPTPSNGDPA